VPADSISAAGRSPPVAANQSYREEPVRMLLYPYRDSDPLPDARLALAHHLAPS